MNTAVVIPARDEEALIEACLESVAQAAPAALIVVVADSCVDATASIARRFGTVIEVNAASVGKARRAGVAAAIAAADSSDLWIANTDADSVVPPNWMQQQLALAADVVVGTVRPAANDLSESEWIAWHATHDDGQALGHVHGANLGFRGDAYLTVGGYAPLDEHEDNDLVHRLHTAGFTISATDQCEVVTSGRRIGRTPGGYAGYLRNGAFATVPVRV